MEMYAYFKIDTDCFKQWYLIHGIKPPICFEMLITINSNSFLYVLIDISNSKLELMYFIVY